MAELLSIQIHAPPMAPPPSDSIQTAVVTIGQGGGGTAAGLTRLKKVDNRAIDGAIIASTSSCSSAVAFGHVPKRQPIDVEFKDLTYSVSEGRNKGY